MTAGALAGPPFQVFRASTPALHDREASKEAVAESQLPDSFPDVPSRSADSIPFLFRHRAGWPTRNIRKCSRNIRLWTQS
jgi:hypothetical protein